MVGDDHLNAQRFGPLHLGHTANTTVHRHNQLGLLGDPFNRFQVKAVPFINAVGDIGANAATSRLQRRHQQCGRRHPVGIEVTIDADRFTALNCPYQARHRLGHVFEPVRIILHGVVVGEKSAHRLRCSHPAVIEHLHQQGVLWDLIE